MEYGSERGGGVVMRVWSVWKVVWEGGKMPSAILKWLSWSVIELLSPTLTNMLICRGVSR